MNKKITSSALAALMIAGSTSFSAFAAMEPGTVVIGDKAFDLAYANDAKNLAEITNAIVAGGAVYVKDFSGKWINNTTGLAVDASVIPAVTYKNAAGVETKFGAKDTDAVTSAMSVSATGAKIIKVTFNSAVDTTKAVVTVKKGSVTVSTSSITWNDAKTAATLVLGGKLTAGDYTVNVAGLTDVALTGTITAGDEKVTKIEILSTEAPLVNVGGGHSVATNGDLQVGYRVLNQYGEDITKITNLTTSSGSVTVSPTTGTVIIAGEYNTTTNKLATFTLIDQATATYASATVTAVSEAKISDVTVKGIYNKDGKAITETTNLASDLFYIELEAKDQYGNIVTNATKVAAEVLITQSNATVVNAAASASVITIDGTKKVVVALTGAPTIGNNIVTAISLASGKSASTTVTVGEGTRAFNVDVAAPDLTVAGETVYIPVNVTDKDGNAITNLSVLKNATRGVKVTVGGTDVTNTELTIKNGQIYIAHAYAAATTTSYSTVMIISNANQKVDTVTLTVKPQAKAISVTGVTTDNGNALLASSSNTVSVDELTVEDQYGRVMTSAQINTWLAASPGKNKIVITEDEASTVVVISATDAITSSNATVTVNAGAAKGTEEITATVYQDVSGTSTELVSSASTMGLRVTDGTEYVSYSVDAVGTVYDEIGATHSDNAAYNKTVKVYGVLANGSKVLLTNGTDYSVGSTNSNLNADVSVDGIINLVNTAAIYTYATGATTKVLPMTVTINATGEKFNQDVTISKVAPKVTTIDVVAQGDGARLIAGTSVDALSRFNNDAATTGVFNFADLDAVADIVVTDQYGKKVMINGTDAFADGTIIANTLTFTKVNGNVVFTGNGTADASVTVLPVDSIFSAVLTFGDVNSPTITITNTSAY